MLNWRRRCRICSASLDTRFEFGYGPDRNCAATATAANDSVRIHERRPAEQCGPFEMIYRSVRLCTNAQHTHKV